MPQTNDPGQHPAGGLIEAVAACRRAGGFLSDLAVLYERVDTAVARKGMMCRACGACCDFDRAGHRLYVSTGELAYLSQARVRLETPSRGRCPYQIGQKCSARPFRTLGCRVYYCRAPASVCQQLYESSHQNIRQLHSRYRLPYQYVELIEAAKSLKPLFLRRRPGIMPIIAEARSPAGTETVPTGA